MKRCSKRAWRDPSRSGCQGSLLWEARVSWAPKDEWKLFCSERGRRVTQGVTQRCRDFQTRRNYTHCRKTGGKDGEWQDVTFKEFGFFLDLEGNNWKLYILRFPWLQVKNGLVRVNREKKNRPVAFVIVQERERVAAVIMACVQPQSQYGQVMKSMVPGVDGHSLNPDSAVCLAAWPWKSLCLDFSIWKSVWK